MEAEEIAHLYYNLKQEFNKLEKAHTKLSIKHKRLQTQSTQDRDSLIKLSKELNRARDGQPTLSLVPPGSPDASQESIQPSSLFQSRLSPRGSVSPSKLSPAGQLA